MTSQKITAVFFLSVIMIFMFLAPVSLVIKQVSKKTEAQDPFTTSIDWEKLYPFDTQAIPQYNAPAKNRLKAAYDYIKRKCEDYTSQYLIGYLRAVEAAKKYEDIIGWNVASVYEYNGVTRLHDGYLTGINRAADVSQNAEAVIDFAGWCTDMGIDFFYVNAPYKICVSEDKNISGILDFSNQNADRFVGMLDEAGVRAYDLRKILHKDGMKHHEAFFRTDHHWKPETGLWAAKHILEFLRDDYGWEVDPEILNPDKFEYKVYPEWFLGSQGTKFMLSRTKPDDFTMIYPKYDTLIHYEIPDKNIDISGDFRITYDMSYVTGKDYYGKNTYVAYDGGNHPLAAIHNYMNNNGRKILVIHDSFGNSVVHFLQWV